MYDPGQLYSDPILTNFSVGYKPQDLIGERIMPNVPVNTQSGRYRVFDRSSWMIFPARREPGTEANEIRGRVWSEDTFKTKEYSLQAPIHDEERQELNSLGGLANPTFGGALQIDPEVDATNFVTGSILLDHEKKVSDLVRNTANYPVGNTVTLAGTQQWDDYTFVTPGIETSVVSNPRAVVQAALIAIRQATKRNANLMVMPRMAIPWIENHPRITDRFKNFSLLQPDAFRLLTGFDGEIVFSDALYNSADNIDATPVYTDLWGKDIWIGIVDTEPTMEALTFGKTFSQIYPDGTIRPTDRWREEKRKTDIVRVSQKWDLKIVSSTAGYLIKNAFSTTAF